MKKHIIRLFLLDAVLTAFALGVLATPVVHAATITVTTTADDTTANGNCTLREAIQAANSDAAVDACVAGSGADTIELAASSTYTLTVADNTDPTLGPNGLPIITSTVTINGHGSTIVRSAAGGTPDFRLFQVNSGGRLQLNDVTISNGKVSGSYLGGGIYISASGTVTITNSTLSGNAAGNNGGAIFNNSGGTLTVSGSTFANNSALNGGGIFNWGTVTIANSTLSGNSASFGGGINNGSNTVTVTNGTLSGNSASTSGGAIYNSGGTVTLKNTIVADSTAGGNCGGTITDGGNNLRWPSSDLSCVGIFGNPKLGTLANNGGQTQTMALQAGSAALERGSSTICAAAPVSNLDQRGSPRPSPASTSCDIGAFESALRPPPTITLAFVPSMILPGQVSTMTVTITNPNSTGAGLTGIGFTDTLPANITVASPPNVSNTCGGAVTAAAGSGVVSLAGGTLTPGATCAIRANVSGVVYGTYTNATDPVSSTESGTGDPSNSATLAVITKTYLPMISK